MSKLILVPLESVPSRYTYYWATHLPKMLKQHVCDEVVVIEADDEVQEATEGAFLNFGYTNVFKAKQLQKIAQMFIDGEVNDNDVFLFTDAWNPSILQVRYMIDLLGIKAKIASIWHAGSYDPADFLGRAIENKNWSFNAERAFYFASDTNFFATGFHFDMFVNNIGLNGNLSVVKERCCLAGFPMEYIRDVCYSNPNKTLITFPHRISVEKQYGLFKQLQAMLPEYEFVVCQEQKLTKDEYYDILSRTKILFSANDQETLGIGVMEGMMSGAYPLVPNKLSYREMYPNQYKYDCFYLHDAQRFAMLIKGIMESPNALDSVSKDAESVFNLHFTGNKMYKKLTTMMKG